ncbi:hypothetical protein SK128_000763 [Halocaridina rubra]|uniref:Uncharacterized protein n=1 Tax=Halocaridina rubra TaxID=373956 RepID=A0AAN8XUR4_HALRR
MRKVGLHTHSRPSLNIQVQLREKAGVYPLLDVDDMVMMQKPDWKCVFTYVQALYKRLKDE